MTEAENEYVIKGNSAVMKCKIPSFVADFVQVEAWINAEDGTEMTYTNGSTDAYGSHAYYYFIDFYLIHFTLSTCFKLMRLNELPMNGSSHTQEIIH